MAAGSVANYIVLDRELLERKDINLTEKVVYAYLRANQESEPSSLTPDFCDHFLDLSESEVRRAWKRLIDVHMIVGEF